MKGKVKVRRWKVVYPDLELRREGNSPSCLYYVESLDGIELISRGDSLWIDFFYMMSCYIDSIEDERKREEIVKKVEEIKEQYEVEIEVVDEEIYCNDFHANNKVKPDFRKLAMFDDKIYLKELIDVLERFRDEEIVPILEMQEREKEKQEVKEDAETRLYNAIFGEDERQEAEVGVMVKNWIDYRLPQGCDWLDITAGDKYLGSVAIPNGARFVTIKVPQDLIGRVIGKGGQNIKALQDKYGIKIKVEAV